MTMKLKGIIFDIRRFSTNDGPGVRTTVFFKGCPLNCGWCHNPEGRSRETQKATRINRIGEREFRVEEEIGKEMSANEVMKEVLSDVIVYEESGGGVTFSGGEPLEQHEFLLELLKISKKNNLHTVLDTTGYTSPEILGNVIELTDLFLYDVKLMNDGEHIKHTGVTNKGILENLEHILQKKKDVIIRFPVVPGVTDSGKNIQQIKEFIAKHNGSLKEIHLLPFHNIADHKYTKLNAVNNMKGIASLKEKDLLPLKEEFESAGIKVKISG
jgi:pyruvate formate lyase activating enzyme